MNTKDKIYDMLSDIKKQSPSLSNEECLLILLKRVEEKVKSDGDLTLLSSFFRVTLGLSDEVELSNENWSEIMSKGLKSAIKMIHAKEQAEAGGSKINLNSDKYREFGKSD